MKSVALTLASVASLSAAETCNLVSWRGKTNVNGAPGSLEKDSGGSNTWNAGAMSTQSLSASPEPQSVTFMCKVGGSVAAGLTNQESGLSYEDIQFAVSCQADGKLSVFESGTYVGAFGDWATTDVYKVQVTGTTVQYYKNGEVFYSSATPATFPLHVDVSMIGEGTKLSDVAMCVPSPCVSSAATWADATNVAAASGSLQKNAGGQGWNAGAISNQELTSSATTQSVSFKCATGAGMMIGELASARTIPDTAIIVPS